VKASNLANLPLLFVWKLTLIAVGSNIRLLTLCVKIIINGLEELSESRVGIISAMASGKSEFNQRIETFLPSARDSHEKQHKFAYTEKEID
jgi:hypothetical protein